VSVATKPTLIQDWQNKRVTVMGLGGFGGGVGVTRWLAAAGAKIVVTDKAPAEKLRNSLDQIADLHLPLHLDGHDARDFRDTDLVIVNPAVPETSEYLQLARDASVPITTEINLFVERCPARCVGITGSVGKSTVTAMIGKVLDEGTKARRHGGTKGRVWVGGNIGRSLLEGLGRITADDIVVLELSSFQLQRTPAVGWSPHVAVVTNITPNHLDWHGSFEAYVAAKLNLVRFQQPRDVVVIQDVPKLRRMLAPLVSDRPGIWRYGLDGDVPFAALDGDDRRLRWEKLKLPVPGRHNRENAAAALTVAQALGVPAEIALSALATFEALPHRLQRVAEREGVTYYNDSKSTTPEAAVTALRAIDAPLLVILGGYDKGSDLRPVAEEAARRACFTACIGKTGPGLAQLVQAAGSDAAVFPDLRAAVRACRERARPGDVVLLSPACASWDQFIDYRARGELFTRLAQGEDV
jgi:UDP-N-acetylmuramoylalanine--D-glutamate ligase